MLVGRRLPVWSTAREIWCDTPRLILTHPVLWAVCLCFYAGVTILDEAATRPRGIGAGSPTIAGWLLDGVLLLLPGIVLIPAALATHRTVILGVVEAPAALLSNGRRILRYGSLEAMIFAVLMAIVGVSKGVTAWSESADGEWVLPVAIIIVIAAICAFVLLILRAAACFPAAAVGDDWPAIVVGWRAMRGQFMKVIALALVTPTGLLSAVWLAVLFAPELLAPDEALKHEHRGVNLFATAILAFAAYAWIITMSHIYKALLGGDALSGRH